MAVAGALGVCAGCGGNSVTSPTTTTTTITTTAADPTITEVYRSTLPVGETKFYSFTVGAYGTVNITLTSVTGAFVPPTVQVQLGLGTPEGTGCTVTTPVMASASSTAQITGTQNPGVYCARIADAGNLYAPAVFAITIAHP